jgi:hypothetical protein
MADERATENRRYGHVAGHVRGRASSTRVLIQIDQHTHPRALGAERQASSQRRVLQCEVASPELIAGMGSCACAHTAREDGSVTGTIDPIEYEKIMTPTATQAA